MMPVRSQTHLPTRLAGLLVMAAVSAFGETCKSSPLTLPEWRAIGDTPEVRAVRFDPPADLSAHGVLAFHLRNESSSGATVRVRVETEPVSGAGRSDDGTGFAQTLLDSPPRYAAAELSLGAGEAGVVRVPLRRAPFAEPLPRISGMRNPPLELRQTLDPSSIAGLAVVTLEGGGVAVNCVVAEGSPEPLSTDRPALLPYVDEFGQYRHRDWPGKVHSRGDLADIAAREAEEMKSHPGPADWNRWGGWSGGPKLDATGAFGTVKVGDRWWLVDPDGCLFWSAGVCAVSDSLQPPSEPGAPPRSGFTIIGEREGWFQSAPWLTPEGAPFVAGQARVLRGPLAGRNARTFAFPAWNLSLKHGEEWREIFSTRVHDRLRSWGFNTLGNWSTPEVWRLRRTPYTLNINLSPARKIQASGGAWMAFPDPFDPEFGAVIERSFDTWSDALDDPWCLGFFLANELAWGGETGLAQASLRSPPDQPAKQALLASLQSSYNDIAALNAAWGTDFASWQSLSENRDKIEAPNAQADLVAFTAELIDRFFRTFREIRDRRAPGRLLLGVRFVVGHSIPPAALAAAARHGDVISFNLYSPHRDPGKIAEALAELPKVPDAPFMITEYGTGATDRGHNTPHLYGVPDQAARAGYIRAWNRAAVDDPRIVGLHWFEFRDQAVTGRALDGEDFNSGLVDVADTPYPETIAAFREVAAEIYPRRAKTGQ